MIDSLHVTNYVLIDRLDLDFPSGLITITGETGSGKSIILGALSLLLGAKGDREDVRKGADRAEISGTFHTSSPLVKEWCDKHDITLEDDELIIRRVIKTEGRSLYTVNGSPVTIKEGEELGETLVDFSSQHAHHSLMKKEVLREMLDDFSSSGELLSSYSDSYRQLTAAQRELEETRKLVESGKEEADYMSYCLKEIEKAALRIGEEEELKEKLQREANSEFLVENLTAATDDLRSASSLLSSSQSSLNKADKKDSSLDELSSRLESASIEIDDIYETLRDYTSSLSFSESEIEEMNSRLSTIQRLRRRYGGSVEEALKTAEDYRNKLSLIEDSSDRIAALERKVSSLRSETEKKASLLSDKRKKGAEKFSSKIEETLHKLGMANAVFTISVTDEPLSPWGKDRIEYLIAPNRGEKTSLIQNSASGGELSRIMLAIKASSTGEGNVETLLFDEIDAGIGGVVAQYVADELKTLSKRSQVITITHLPQIASRADEHFLVEKKTSGERTLSSIREVRGEERVMEIARLLSGDVTPISKMHAEELLSGN